MGLFWVPTGRSLLPTVLLVVQWIEIDGSSAKFGLMVTGHLAKSTTVPIRQKSQVLGVFEQNSNRFNQEWSSSISPSSDHRRGWCIDWMSRFNANNAMTATPVYFKKGFEISSSKYQIYPEKRFKLTSNARFIEVGSHVSRRRAGQRITV